jgi:hypothetical protein
VPSQANSNARALNCGRASAIQIVTSVLSCVLPITTASVAEEMRWRVADHGDTLSLYTAEFDDGTDFIGPLNFECVRGKNHLVVRGDLDETGRIALADLMRQNGYPIVTVPETKYASVIEPRYSEMTGWQFEFSIAPAEQGLSSFARTGVFEFEIGKTPVRYEFTPGLEAISAFQEACRKAAP